MEKVNVKRILCLALSLIVACGMFGTAAFAVPALEAEINDVTFMSNGVELRKFPAVGEPVSAQVSTDADALALVLAAYDDNGALVDMALNTAGTTVGTLTMSEEIANIRLLTWNDINQMVPVSGEEYLLTDVDPDNPGALQEFLINGVPAAMEGDTITATVPAWDADGNAVSTYTVQGVTSDGTGSITIGDVAMQAGEEKAVALEPTSVTVTENGQSATYYLNLQYSITEDFDTQSVFDNSYQMTGSATVQNAWEQESIVKGNLAGETFKFTVQNSNTETMGTYQPNLSIGVNPVSMATGTDGNTPLDTADTAAGGHALRISKTTSVDNDTDSGRPIFVIENADLFRDAETPLVVEYDLAVDYSKATAGVIGLNGAGIRYGGYANERYSIYDNTALLPDADGNVVRPDATQTTLKLRTHDGSGIVNTDTGATLDRWHHIRQVFDRQANTATTYVDGVPYCESYDLSNAGGYQEALNLCFSPSARRAADIWIDNLQITWGQNYAAVLNSMTVAGQPAEIDGVNNLVTVSIPLWDAAGAEIDPSNVPVVLNATEAATVGDTAVANDMEQTIDLSEAKQITVGSGETGRVYDMVIYRTIFDDFDANTVFSGTATGSATALNTWEGNTNLITGEKANSVMSLTLINGSEDYLNYQSAVSAAVASITSAKALDGETIRVSPSSGAAGNALRLSKTRSISGVNTGSPILRVQSDDFKDAKTVINIEYDLAFDYNNVTEGNFGLLGAGARYGSQNEAAVSDNGMNSSTKPETAFPRLYFGSNTAYSTFMNCPANAWMHVKIALNVTERSATTTATLLNTTTGREETRTIDNGVLDGGEGLNGSSAYNRANWNDQLNYTFATSAQRGADLWVDNLSITYDVSTTK